MRVSSPIAVLLAASIIGGAAAIALLHDGPEATSSATPSDSRPAGVRSWAFAIGDGTLEGPVERRYAPFDLVVVDGEEARAGQVGALRGAGKLVLGYLSVGTIEPGRSWYRAAKPYRLDRYAEFGEWYADSSRAGYRRLIADRVAPKLLRKGFDGLFLDNTDMVETHPRQVRGMRLLVGRLARLVHTGGDLLFTQNGEDSIGPTLRHYDGWNREDVTWTYSFKRRRYVHLPARASRAAQATLRRIGDAGLLVTATDYVAKGDARAERESIANACAAGALPYVSDIGLRRVSRAPLVCP